MCDCLKGDTLRQTWNDSYSVRLCLCLWANRFGGLWAQLHVCIKRGAHTEKMPTADEIFTECSKVKQFSLEKNKKNPTKTPLHLCCCPFLWGQKFTFKIKHLYFIVADNLWLVRRVAQGFNISATANSHQRLKHKAEWTRQRNENTTWVFYLSSTATLTCLSPARSRCSFYCRLKLQLQTLLKPFYSSDLNTWQAEHLSTSSRLFLFFLSDFSNIK